MEACITVGVTTILEIFAAFWLWENGFKRYGIMLLRGAVGAFCVWGFLVLAIGLAPIQ